MRKQKQNHGMKALPHRKDDPPTGATSSRSRAAARRGSRLLLGTGRRTNAGTGTPPMPSPWLEAATAAQPRVNGPAVKVLTLWPGADAGRGCV